jgi:restriction system protein
MEGGVMARRNRQSARVAKRKEGAAIQLMGWGAALLVIPSFVSSKLMTPALTQLRPLGGLMLLAGGVLFWLMHRKSAPLAAPRAPEPARAQFVRSAAVGGPEGRPAKELNPLKAAPTEKAGMPASTPDSWSAAVFDVIEWRRFEAVVELLFQQAGFETKSQSYGADGGVDVWLFSRHAPGKPVSLVQCKHWQGKRVGVDKVRELRGVMAAHGVSRGQFATTSTFTQDAVAFARENHINLLDVSGLMKLISLRTPEQQAALLAIALEGEYWRPTCVNCGTKLVERTPRNGGAKFWGCPTFPACKTTMPMRSAAA